MYSPVARKYFHTEVISSLDEKRKIFSSPISIKSASLPASKTLKRKNIKRHQSLPDINEVKEAVSRNDHISCLSLIDSDLQLMKVIQERDKLNLELIKLQKINKTLVSTLAVEKENFENNKNKIFDIFNVEKLKAQLNKSKEIWLNDKKHAEECHILLAEKGLELQDLKAKFEKAEACLEEKNEEIRRLKNESEERSLSKDQVHSEIEKLKVQLNRARETSMNERKTAKTYQTDLWKKEKELKDLKIDLKISQRSLKAAEEQIKKINTEGYEFVANALKDKEAVFNEEKESLQEEIKKLRSELDEARAEINQEKSSNSTISSKLQSVKTECNGLKLELEKLNAAHKVAKSNSKTAAATIEDLKKRLANTEMNKEALKTACKEMDEQLDEYENLNETLRQREVAFLNEIKNLEESQNKLKNDLKESRIEVNEEKSLHIATKSKLNSALKDLEETNKELTEWKTTALVTDNQLKSTEAELVELKEKYTLMEEDMYKLQCHLDVISDEFIALKEERSQLLTQIYTIKEEKYQLEEKICALEDDNSCLQSSMSELRSSVAQLKEFQRQSEIKYESTVQQQSKLINFLQNHIDILKKKKKTLAEKLFKSPTKENVDPRLVSKPNMDCWPPDPSSIKALSISEKARCLENLRNCAANNRYNNFNNEKPASVRNLTQKFNTDTYSVAKEPVKPKEDSKEKLSIIKNSEDFFQDLKTSCPAKYKGNILKTFSNGNRLRVNCLEHVQKSLYLLGCDEGLYSLQLQENKDGLLVKISGISFVQQIMLLKRLDLALFISGETSSMTVCNLRQVISNAEAAECSEPSITVEELYDSITRAHDIVKPPKIEAAQLSNCYVFAVSDCNSYLCVSSAGNVTIFERKKFSFQPVRHIKAEQPVSWFSFTSKSVFFATDKLYETELISGHFSIKSFINENDSSLTYLTSRSRNTYPMAVYELGPEREFLICFNTCGVFVNTAGKRCRDDIKWTHFPAAFAYSKPLLTIVHYSSISIMKISPLNNRLSDGSSSTVDLPDTINVEFTSLRLLGLNTALSRVYVSDISSKGVNVVSFSAAYAFRDDPDVSLLSTLNSSSSCSESNDDHY